MAGFMRIRVWDVEHGCCAMVQYVMPAGFAKETGGRLAMVDSGSSPDFRPSMYIKNSLGRSSLDYLFITNADQDHMSDLKGLEDAGITVHTLIRNPSYTAEQMRQIKRISGPLTSDATWYANACDTYKGGAPDVPFDQGMNGIKYRSFYNPYGRGPGQFMDTNNLSHVIFISYAGFVMLFPGDLEKPAWKALLQRKDFVDQLMVTDVLMASHHGRESGFCPEVFDHMKPQVVVISDKPIMHATQQTVPDYRRITTDAGIFVQTTGKRRHVLTTRRDGWVNFDVYSDGTFNTTTECQG
jgi:beta-lactamase superfamily II metal-dependent hydrolase